jgi:hypothetical protein
MRRSLAHACNPCMSGVDCTVSKDTEVFAGLDGAPQFAHELLPRSPFRGMGGQRTVSTLAVKT